MLPNILGVKTTPCPMSTIYFLPHVQTKDQPSLCINLNIRYDPFFNWFDLNPLSLATLLGVRVNFFSFTNLGLLKSIH